MWPPLYHQSAPGFVASPALFMGAGDTCMITNPASPPWRECWETVTESSCDDGVQPVASIWRRPSLDFYFT